MMPVTVRLIKTVAVVLALPASSKREDSMKEKSTLPPNQDDGRNTIAVSAVIIIAAYIAAQMLADVASLKIGIIFGLTVDMGTFIYPITFTLRDLVHKQLGKKNARAVILSAGCINLFMALYLMLCDMAPGQDPAFAAQFHTVLGPMWRIVLASIAAEVVSELVDTEIYHLFVTKITTKHQWARVLVSNSVSIPIDNFIFSFGAFYLTMPLADIWQIFVFNLIVKFAMTLGSIPLIYLVPQKKSDQ